MIPNTLYHIIQAITLIQMKWMVMKRLDGVDAKHRNSILSFWHCNWCYRLFCQHIYSIKYLSFRCISLHQQQPPQQISHRLRKPYNQVHIRAKAQNNKLLHQPLPYLESYCCRFLSVLQSSHLPAL